MLASARSLLVLVLCTASTALAVNLIYDEVLWTKQAWEKAKFPNPLRHTNPSDQEPKLLEVYPSIKGTLANSLDGPNERRDNSNAPSADAEVFEGFSGLEPITADAHVKPASEAVQCTVCHALMGRVWQHVLEHVVEGLSDESLGMAGVFKKLMSPSTIHKQLQEDCKDEAMDEMLKTQAIYQLGNPQSNVMFFVVRERRKANPPATATERKAVRLACKTLIQESRDDIGRVVAEHQSAFTQQLEALLKKHGLLDALKPPAAIEGNDEGRPANKPAAGEKGGDEAGAAATEGGLAVQVVGLVQDVLRKIAASSTQGAADSTGSAAKDDDYEDEADPDEDPECTDMHPMCMQWADAGECEANPVYMVGKLPDHKGHCRKSCGICIPRKKGERGPTGSVKTAVDTTELQAKYPALAADLEALAKPLLQGVRNKACGASQACLTGVAGMAAGAGFMLHSPEGVQQQQQNSGWKLGTPFFGEASVDKLSPADLKALEAEAAKRSSGPTGHAPAEPGSLAAEVDEALGQELKGKVISVAGDFFIYEYVYKNHTRHYHVDASGKYTEDYLLGTFQRESVNVINAATGKAAVLEERDLLPDVRALLLQKEWPYVKQVYAGGDECMLSGGRRAVRKTEARITCSPDGKLSMLVREPDFCHYVYVIYSPALCGVERFKPVHRPLPKAAAKKKAAQQDDDDDEYL